MTPNNLLQDQVAVVTGGGGGIGRAIALALAGAGADVVIGDVVPERCEETVARIAELGRRSVGVATNVIETAQVEALIDRARAAGCSALVLTLDLQILGQRHKDLKNGLSAPPKLTVGNLLNMATKPRWCLGMLGTRRRTFGNIVGHAKDVGDPSSLFAWTVSSNPPRPTPSW